MDKPLARLNKKQREKIEISNIKVERENITIDPIHMKNVIQEY